MVKVISLAPLNKKPPFAWLRQAFARPASPMVIRPAMVYSNGQMTCQQPEGWNARIPVGPEAAFQILSRDLPELRRMELILQTGDHLYMDIRASDFVDHRTFNLGRRYTGNGNIIVEETKQHNGIGRILVRNEIEFARALDIRRFSILAGSKAGGYFWANMGFVPDDVGSTPFDIQTRQRAMEKYKALKPFLKNDEKKQTAPLLAFREAGDLYRLARLPVDLTDRLKGAFNGAAGPDACLSNLSQVMGEHFADRVKNSKHLGIGQLLLAGTCWHGHLDLRNVQQMRRVDDYVGGFKYIGFK